MKLEEQSLQPPNQPVCVYHCRVKIFLSPVVCLDTKLLSCFPATQGIGAERFSEVSNAGARQHRQHGSGRAEVCVLPGSRAGGHNPGARGPAVVEPEVHVLRWSVGPNTQRVPVAHSTAAWPRELLRLCLQTESSGCH